MHSTIKMKAKVNMLTAPLFQLFWENSKINEVTEIKLAESIESDASKIHLTPQLLYPSADLQLKQPKDRLADLMQKRQSLRNFSSKTLSEKQLGSLCFAFGQVQETRRLLASAGGKYPIEVFAITQKVKSEKINQKILYYNADNHSLSLVKAAPEWEKINKFISPDFESIPAIIFFFVAFPERTCAKYQERGGRFILIEAGQYAQNLALRLAEEKLVGYELGSVHDDKVKNILGLEKTNALICLAYACGAP